MQARPLGGTTETVDSVDERVGARFVQRFSDAWQTCDPDALASLLTDDVVLRTPLMPVLEGRRAAREAFARLFAMVPDLRATVHRWAENDDVVFVEFTLHGTFGGREVSWPAVDRFLIRDGLAAERVSYFDSAPVAIQMLTRPRGWRRVLGSGFRPRLRAASGARGGSHA